MLYEWSKGKPLLSTHSEHPLSVILLNDLLRWKQTQFLLSSSARCAVQQPQMLFLVCGTCSREAAYISTWQSMCAYEHCDMSVACWVPGYSM